MARNTISVLLLLPIVAVGTAQAQPPSTSAAPADGPSSRLFYTPTARALPPGEGYAAFFGVVMPLVQVGVTTRFSIGGGTPLIPNFDDWERPFWMSPKLQVFDSGATQVAVGALHAFSLRAGGGGFGYGVVTRGTSDASLTIGLALGYGGDGPTAGGLMLAGEQRVSSRTRVIGEALLPFSGGATVLAGVRRFRGRFSFDYGVVVPVSGDLVAAFPLLTVAYKF